MLNYLNLYGGNKDLDSKSIEQTYVKLSPIEHVLKKPGMYVGDLDFRSEKQFIYDEKSNQIIQKNINWSPGLYKIVDELIVNAYEQSIIYNNIYYKV
jgi:DNA topoisomerase-2